MCGKKIVYDDEKLINKIIEMKKILEICFER